ncbi:MAG: substrate-binding domain-containing protein, partial [Thermoguttaceae bacterium]
TVAYLKPVLLVRKGNPKSWQTLADVLGSGATLGVVDEDVCGIGKTAAELIEKEQDIKPELKNEENVKYFNSQLSLLRAFENGTVEAAICWDQAVYSVKDSADVVPFPANEVAATPLLLITLSTSLNYKYAEIFGIFVDSVKGQSILKKLGYVVR